MTKGSPARTIVCKIVACPPNVRLGDDGEDSHVNTPVSPPDMRLMWLGLHPPPNGAGSFVSWAVDPLHLWPVGDRVAECLHRLQLRTLALPAMPGGATENDHRATAGRDLLKPSARSRSSRPGMSRDTLSRKFSADSSRPACCSSSLAVHRGADHRRGHRFRRLPDHRDGACAQHRGS